MSAPLLPNPPPAYESGYFAQLLRTLRTYFVQLEAVRHINIASCNINLDTLPTTATGARDGDVWVDGNTLKVAGLAGGGVAAHSHAISDVTGLQTALDGKAAAVHTHASTEVTDFAEAVDDRVASLLVAGSNITLTYNDAGNALTIAASAGGTPGGADTQVQFNNSGAFGGSANFTWNNATGVLLVAGKAQFADSTSPLKLSATTVSTPVVLMATAESNPGFEVKRDTGARIARIEQSGSASFGPNFVPYTWDADYVALEVGEPGCGVVRVKDTDDTMLVTNVAAQTGDAWYRQNGATNVARILLAANGDIALQGNNGAGSPVTWRDLLRVTNAGVATVLGTAVSLTGHSHAISDVTNLQTTLDGKAATTHSHAISDVTNLQTTLDGKAATTHSHAISDVTNLQTTLDGKAATTHSHAISDVTNLQTTLDGKAPLGSLTSSATTSGTLTAAEKGKVLKITGAVTINGSVHAADDVFALYCNSDAAQSITQGSGMTLRKCGTLTTGTLSLTGRGWATVWFISATEAVVSGNV